MIIYTFGEESPPAVFFTKTLVWQAHFLECIGAESQGNELTNHLQEAPGITWPLPIMRPRRLPIKSFRPAGTKDLTETKTDEKSKRREQIPNPLALFNSL
ncbi:hypothetical protein AMQ84_10725 [Paenibacillus riograndensis]|uniref:Uncharacterized protein n=1 Tax=Paenibacillus riograndensis TaxID=483937 RepID=A0A132U331_9BACL|nr:hypothetical protein AMQ84_10725 [Paenibacillus riograndensis]